jgi:hypothetical protein
MEWDGPHIRDGMVHIWVIPLSIWFEAFKGMDDMYLANT